MAFIDIKSCIYLVAFCLICINLSNVASLTCFRKSTDRVREADLTLILADMDQNDVTNCPNCSVCGIAVDGKKLRNDAALMPITDEMDNLKPYEEFFKIPNTLKSVYKVLTVCVMERYRFSVRSDKEYNFRCMCNRNYCNGATNVIDYLTRQVSSDVAD